MRKKKKKKHYVVKAQSELGQLKIAAADEKWDESNQQEKREKLDLELDLMRQNERGESTSPHFAMQTWFVDANVCCHNYRACVLRCWKRYSTICRLSRMNQGNMQWKQVLQSDRVFS